MRYPRLLPVVALLTLALANAAAARPHPRPAPAPADPCGALATSAPLDPVHAPAFGCANALNLRLMVADPHDLDAGAPLAPAGVEHDVAAVQRYRLGQVRPLGQAPAATPATQDTSSPQGR